MRIAITGGSGFLGNYVMKLLIRENHNPIILTRQDNKNNNDDYEYIVTDYSKSDLLDKLSNIDAIVHLAARRGSQGLISEFHDNEILTQNLYETCYERNIKNIVYASSISVYSDEKSLPWTEEVLPSPALMYGISKMVNEHIGNMYSAKKNLNIKNLRFAHLYGFNEKNNYMINRFFRQAFHGEQLVLHNKSVARREFLYAKDAAKAILCALEQYDLSGTFNIGSGEALTNFDVAYEVNKVFKNQGNLRVINQDGKENIDSSYMDSNKAKKVLGFTTDYNFSDALHEIYSLMKELDDVPILY